jgi:hypothetical protein
MSDINKEWHEKVEGECPHEQNAYMGKNPLGRSIYKCLNCPELSTLDEFPAYDEDPAVFKKAVAEAGKALIEAEQSGTINEYTALDFYELEKTLKELEETK